MPVAIPNNLHFIWIGPDLETKRAMHLTDWAIQNPTHACYLWTEVGQIEGFAKVITTAMRVLYPQVQIFRDVDPTKVLKKSYEAYQTSEEQHRAFTYTNPCEVTLLAVLPDHFQIPITITAKNLLPALIDTDYLYGQIHQHKNYEAAAVILRLMAVHRKGGIAVTENMRCTTPLPVCINAPRDVLFNTAPAATEQTYDTNIIAAAKYSPQIRSIAAMLESEYHSRHIREYQSRLPQPEQPAEKKSFFERLRERKKKQTRKIDLAQPVDNLRDFNAPAAPAPKMETSSFTIFTEMPSAPISDAALLFKWLWEDEDVDPDDPSTVDTYSFQRQTGFM